MHAQLPRGELMKRRQAVRVALALAGSQLFPRDIAAQPRGRPFRIGIVGVGSPEGATTILQAFNEGLREQGLVEGREIESVYRWARGSVDEVPALARELANLPVDVIVAGNNTAIAGAKGATSTIPIVMVLGIDPIRNGFIESLARPGRNITGLTNDPGQGMHGKMLGLLKELVPAASVIGVLVQQGVGFDREAVEEGARLLNVQVYYPPEVRRSQDLEPAFEAMKRAGVQAIYVIGGALIYQHRQSVAELTLQHRLPSMHFTSDFVRAGALVSYGTDLRLQYRRAAWYIARILNGAKPAELAVEQPAKFETAINLRTAKAFGLVVSPSLLLRADEVIR